MEENKIIENVLEDGGKPKSFFSNKKILFIVVGAVVALAVLFTILWSFFGPKSFVGCWELTVNPEIDTATDDQIEDSDRVYYIFDKANRYGNGKWKICYDGGIEYYEYELIEKDGEEKINLGSTDLEYKFSGSKLFGNAKITLIYPEYTDEETGQVYEAQEYVLEQAREPKYDKDSYDDFVTDEKLIGDWATNERTLSYFYYNIPYVETVNFNDNGVMVIHYESEELALNRYMYYAYTVEDDTLTFSLVTDKETKFSVKYEFDKNGNLKFIDDTTESSIFADAFFGDVTFYTPENLPESSQATVDELVVAQ